MRHSIFARNENPFKEVTTYPRSREVTQQARDVRQQKTELLGGMERRACDKKILRKILLLMSPSWTNLGQLSYSCPQTFPKAKP